MARYIDGFVIPIKKKDLPAYTKMAKEGREVWMKHGALQYFECVGDDLNPDSKDAPKTLGFPKLAKLKEDETVIFAFVVYKSRKHRDVVNAKVMKEMDEMYADIKDQSMPFDMARMAYGGFNVIVEG